MKKGMIGVLSLLAGFVGGAASVGKVTREQIHYKQQMSEKHLSLFLMMNQWVKVKQERKNLASYLEEKGYRKIAVYGMSYAGETFIDELKNTNIQVIYGIDQKADRIYANVNLVTIDDNLEEVDAVIVTAITFFDEIKENLSEKMDCPILSLEDILYEV